MQAASSALRAASSHSSSGSTTPSPQLPLGAVVLLLSTLAVTEACRSIGNAAQYEAEHHNALVDQRRVIEQRAALQASVTPN